MESKKVLAYIIRDLELSQKANGETLSYGYKTQDNRPPFTNYMSNESFKLFIESFNACHKEQYEEGKGGELSEKRNRYGNFNPPKMASFASSSRMVYNLSKNISGFIFEKQLKTEMGGNPANLDGYLHKNATFYFVEAKCQEIFGSHSRIRNAYRDLFEFISKDEKNLYAIKCEKSDKEESFKAEFSYNGTIIKRFDIKQMISHMLGISNAFIDGGGEYKINGGKIRFIYLLYNPTEAIKYALNSNFDYISNRNATAISKTYNDVVDEINMINMGELFGSVVRYQLAKKKLPYDDLADMLINSFSFVLTSQDDYLKTIV